MLCDLIAPQGIVLEMPFSFPGSAQQTGYFWGLPRLCGFTGTSFVLGVRSSGLERLWPGTLTGFAPGLAIMSSECLNASTIPASQQSGNVGHVYKIGRLWLPSGGRHDPSRGVGRRPGLAFCGTGAEWNGHNHRCGVRGWGVVF